MKGDENRETGVGLPEDQSLQDGLWNSGTSCVLDLLPFDWKEHSEPGNPLGFVPLPPSICSRGGNRISIQDKNFISFGT